MRTKVDAALGAARDAAEVSCELASPRVGGSPTVGQPPPIRVEDTRSGVREPRLLD
jgi:hypothetical protein